MLVSFYSARLPFVKQNKTIKIVSFVLQKDLLDVCYDHKLITRILEAKLKPAL